MVSPGLGNGLGRIREETRQTRDFRFLRGGGEGRVLEAVSVHPSPPPHRSPELFIIPVIARRDVLLRISFLSFLWESLMETKDAYIIYPEDVEVMWKMV